jgi:MFS transporter, OFA family, oxalate/formate antiporter
LGINKSSADNSQNIQKSSSRKSRSPIYYGFVIVLACFMLTMLGRGIFYIYGVFFGSIEKEFDWNRAVTSGAFSISVLISGLCGMLAGRMCDKYGPRVVIAFCALFLSMGYILMSVVHNTFQFYLIYGILVSAGVSGFWAPLLSTLARWFTVKRGLMTGIVTGGISFGTLFLPPLATQLIDAFDWRTTYIIMGLMVLAVSAVGIFLLKRFPQKKDLEIGKKYLTESVSLDSLAVFDLQEALHTRQFWMVCAIYIFFGIIQMTVMVHIIPHAVGLNISAVNAATVLSVVGIVSLAARIVIGAASDKIKVKISVVFCLGLLMLGFIWLLFATELWQLYIFAIMFGLGYGGMSCLQSLVASELYGLLSLGAISAIFAFAQDIGGAAGPYLSGFIFDVTSSYQWAFIVCALSAFLALILSALLTQPRND